MKLVECPRCHAPDAEVDFDGHPRCEHCGLGVMTFMEWREKWFENDGTSVRHRYLTLHHAEWWQAAEQEIGTIKPKEHRFRAHYLLKTQNGRSV